MHSNPPDAAARQRPPGLAPLARRGGRVGRRAGRAQRRPGGGRGERRTGQRSQLSAVGQGFDHWRQVLSARRDKEDTFGGSYDGKTKKDAKSRKVPTHRTHTNAGGDHRARAPKWLDRTLPCLPLPKFWRSRCRAPEWLDRTLPSPAEDLKTYIRQQSKQAHLSSSRIKHN